VTIWLEYAHDGEPALDVCSRPQDHVTWEPRKDAGRHLIDTVVAALPPADPTACYWVAGEAASTRGIVRHPRKDPGVDKRRICALGYWQAA
jgi:NADPH-dependent ferric siderophore reductase